MRVKNNTPYSLENLSIKIGESENHYGTLTSNQTSGYKVFTSSGYAFIKLTEAGKEAVFLIELMGVTIPANDRQLPPLTCVIQVDETTDQLDLHFEQ